MEIDYVTSNTKKFEEAERILLRSKQDSDYITLIHSNLHLEELQGSTEEIAIHKAKTAYSILNKPVIVDDISVHCNALSGLPGPYIKHFLTTLGAQGFYEMLSHYSDRSCQAICTVAFYDGKGSPHLFTGTLSGIIVEPRGTKTQHGPHSWNSIVQPDGFSLTCAEMTLDELSHVSARCSALEKLHSYLQGYIKGSI